METALTESQEKSPAQSNVETVLEGKLQSEASLLDDIISSTRLVRHEAELSRAKDLIGRLVREALEGEVVIKKDLETAIDVRIAALDELISAQLNEVMHAPEFQKLEGSWRGLHYLVHQSETSTMLKIRLMNVSKDDLRKDLERASEFDQSALFKKVYEEEYGTFGGASYGALIGDYEFGRHPQDMSLLEHISHVAAAAHAPFFAAAHPRSEENTSELQSRFGISY